MSIGPLFCVYPWKQLWQQRHAVWCWRIASRVLSQNEVVLIDINSRLWGLLGGQKFTCGVENWAQSTFEKRVALWYQKGAHYNCYIFNLLGSKLSCFADGRCSDLHKTYVWSHTTLSVHSSNTLWTALRTFSNTEVYTRIWWIFQTVLFKMYQRKCDVRECYFVVCNDIYKHNVDSLFLFIRLTTIVTSENTNGLFTQFYIRKSPTVLMEQTRKMLK